jgi:hypothetical protein
VPDRFLQAQIQMQVQVQATLSLEHLGLHISCGETVCSLVVQFRYFRFFEIPENGKDEAVWREVHAVLGYLEGRGGWVPDC